MGRPKKPAGEKRAPFCSIRATPEEAKMLKDGAARDGVPLGRWLREMGLRRSKRV